MSENIIYRPSILYKIFSLSLSIFLLAISILYLAILHETYGIRAIFNGIIFFVISSFIIISTLTCKVILTKKLLLYKVIGFILYRIPVHQITSIHKATILGIYFIHYKKKNKVKYIGLLFYRKARDLILNLKRNNPDIEVVVEMKM